MEPKGHIHWVVALRPEAEVIIRTYRMKQVANDQAGFAVWKGEGASGELEHWLVLTGLGKLNSAAAAAWLQQVSGNPGNCAWINFGIAGHRSRPIGEVNRALKIEDASLGKCWYPVAVWKRKQDVISQCSLLTVDEPTGDYPTSDTMIEMEASGFVSAASRFSTMELIHSVKVISDNSESGIEEISKAKVIELCTEAVNKIQPWIQALEEVVLLEVRRCADPPLFHELLIAHHFSETQKHQLRKLLIRITAVDSPKAHELSGAVAGCTSGKAVLAKITGLAE